MAEQVQAILDRMVPALRDLTNKGIFSESEIKAIVTRRRSSEYLLRRRNPRKTDFSRYIEAEENLEKLRSLRTRRFVARKAAKDREEGIRRSKEEAKGGGEEKKEGGGSSSSIGDASIVQLIHLLFARAKRKWQQDLTWHLQHAEFAKRSCSFKILSKIYAEALQLHPRNASLWIEAASHEFFGHVTSPSNYGISGGGSIKNARILLQRGLRINPSSKELWIQYFCLEMHYIQKLRGRRKLLQLDKRAVLCDQDQDQDEHEDAGDGEGVTGVQAVYEEAKLPRIIYRNAIQAIPDDVQFRVEFVNRCSSFPRSAVLEEEIMQSVKADFGGLEEAWIARASYELERGGIGERDQYVGFLKGVDVADHDDGHDDGDLSGEVSRKRKRTAEDPTWTLPEDRVAELLDQATNSINTPDMYIKSISFQQQHLLRLSENGNNNDIERNEKMATIGRSISFLLNKASDKNISSPQLALITADILVEIGRPFQAAQSLQHKIQHDKKCRNNSHCWTRWADISRRMQILPPQPLAADANTMNPHRPTKILRDALNIIPIHDSGHYAILSRLFLTLLAAVSPSTTKMPRPRRRTVEREIGTLFQRLLLLNHQIRTPQTDHYHYHDVQPTLPNLALAYFHHLILDRNLPVARKVYRQVLFESNFVQRPDKTDEEVDATVELYESSIAMEVSSLEDTDGHRDKKVGQDALRRLYDGVIGFLEGRDDFRLAHVFRRRKMEDIA